MKNNNSLLKAIAMGLIVFSCSIYIAIFPSINVEKGGVLRTVNADSLKSLNLGDDKQRVMEILGPPLEVVIDNRRGEEFFLLLQGAEAAFLSTEGLDGIS